MALSTLKNNRSLAKLTHDGFTLLEILIALAIISIGLGALLKATAASTKLTLVLKEKAISHIVAFEGVAMIQLGLLRPQTGTITTEKTKLMHKYWYWRPEITPTPIKDIDLIKITVSAKSTGPYKNTLYAFLYHHDN